MYLIEIPSAHASLKLNTNLVSMPPDPTGPLCCFAGTLSITVYLQNVVHFFFQIWNNDLEISVLHSANMRPYNWSYTQFSQFNTEDTLLLVSGVYIGPHSSSSGEIAVFNLGS